MGNVSITSDGPDTPERIFGRRLRRERVKRGWRQEDLAVWAAGHGAVMHSSAIAKIEAGTRMVRLDHAVALAAALGVPLSRLLSDDDVSAKALRLEQVRAAQDAAMAESDAALERAVNLWRERRDLMRDLASEGALGEEES